MKINIGSVANNVQIGRGGRISSNSTDESISVTSSKSSDLVDFYAKNLHASKVITDDLSVSNFSIDQMSFEDNAISSKTNFIIQNGSSLKLPWKSQYIDLYTSDEESTSYLIDVSQYKPYEIAGIQIKSTGSFPGGNVVIGETQYSWENLVQILNSILQSIGSPAPTITYSNNFLEVSSSENLSMVILSGYGYETIDVNNELNCTESSPHGFGLLNSRYISNCILGFQNIANLADNILHLPQNYCFKISDGLEVSDDFIPQYLLKHQNVFTNKEFVENTSSLQNGYKYICIFNNDSKSIEFIRLDQFYFETKSNQLSSLPTDGSYLYARIQKLNYNYKFNTSTNQWEISHFCKFGNLEVDTSGNKSFYPEYPVNFNPMDLQEQLNNASVKKYVKTFTVANFSNNKMTIPVSEHNLGSDCSLLYARKKIMENSITYYKNTFVQFYIDTNGNVTIEAEPFEGKLVLQIV